MPPMIGQISLFPYNFAPAGTTFSGSGTLTISRISRRLCPKSNAIRLCETLPLGGLCVIYGCDYG